jgi:hypothetical protein
MFLENVLEIKAADAPVERLDVAESLDNDDAAAIVEQMSSSSWLETCNIRERDCFGGRRGCWQARRDGYAWYKTGKVQIAKAVVTTSVRRITG